MNLTTRLNEQARLVRGALVAGNLEEARTALRFIFEDRGEDDNSYKEIRPAQIIGLALFPLDDAGIGAVRDTFIRQADRVFPGRTDALDAEIRSALFAALYRDRK